MLVIFVEEKSIDSGIIGKIKYIKVFPVLTDTSSNEHIYNSKSFGYFEFKRVLERLAICSIPNSIYFITLDSTKGTALVAGPPVGEVTTIICPGGIIIVDCFICSCTIFSTNSV